MHVVFIIIFIRTFEQLYSKLQMNFKASVITENKNKILQFHSYLYFAFICHSLLTFYRRFWIQVLCFSQVGIFYCNDEPFICYEWFQICSVATKKTIQRNYYQSIFNLLIFKKIKTQKLYLRILNAIKHLSCMLECSGFSR